MITNVFFNENYTKHHTLYNSMLTTVSLRKKHHVTSRIAYVS